MLKLLKAEQNDANSAWIYQSGPVILIYPEAPALLTPGFYGRTKRNSFLFCFDCFNKVEAIKLAAS